jgi:hypothetical protein
LKVCRRLRERREVRYSPQLRPCERADQLHVLCLQIDYERLLAVDLSLHHEVGRGLIVPMCVELRDGVVQLFACRRVFERADGVGARVEETLNPAKAVQLTLLTLIHKMKESSTIPLPTNPQLASIHTPVSFNW